MYTVCAALLALLIMVVKVAFQCSTMIRLQAAALVQNYLELAKS